MSHRFLLNDLTPATRTLYRAYLAAVREQRRLGDLLDAAYHRQQVPATTLWHIDQNPTGYDHDVRERTAQSLADATAAYNRADERWRAACETATAAFQAAIPAMEAEGYSRHWFNTPTGAMRLPAGQPSPGQNRPGRTRARH